MSRFNDRIERDLRHIADRATPSPTAWEAIQTRTADHVDHPDLEITMLKPNPQPDRSARTWLLGAAAALLIVGGLAFVLSSDDDSPVQVTDDDPVDTPTTTVAPTTTLTPQISPEALATIDEFLNADDMDGIRAVVTEGAIANSDASALMAGVSEWLVARRDLGVEVEVISCLEIDGGPSLRCQVRILSPVSAAFGQEPRERGVTFDFTDGAISTWPAIISGPDFDETRQAAIDAGFGDEMDALCMELTTECAEFVLANLDEWAAG